MRNRIRKALSPRNRGPWILASALLVALLVAPFAGAFGEGNGVKGGSRNPSPDARRAYTKETEIIANACLARGIPLLSLRVISDTSTESLPAPPNVLFDVNDQKTNFVKLSLYLLMHPRANRRLFRFARQIRLARENLADSLITLL